VELLHFSHHYTVALFQWVNHLHSAWGGSGLQPQGAPTLLELGSPANYVSLHLWPKHDPWSPAIIGPLCLWFAMTLATGCFSTLLVPVQSLQSPKDYSDTLLGSCKVRRLYWGACVLTPLHSLTGPVCQLFASRLGGSGSCPCAPTLLELGSPFSNVSLYYGKSWRHIENSAARSLFAGSAVSRQRMRQ
jgi:hypothetical protein